jgi:bifunctional N-acetylglucosamine-1-phosphate-uridyltransferase/glucosamine-1-phosphate-acetyltransferase GlmU-like protein
MKCDYRNYLFENYLKVVKEFKPKLFVFENVQGILSAKPDGIHIILYHQAVLVQETMEQYFTDINYTIQDHENYPGTGGAVMNIDLKHQKTLVLNGDMPLVEAKELLHLTSNDTPLTMSVLNLVNANGYGRVIIENKVEIGALCSIDKGVSADTVIGSGTKLDNHVQIGHDTLIGKNCLLGSQVAIAGVTTIEDDVLIWAKVAINKDLVIGKGAVILATSNVDKSLKGGITYFGSPAIEAKKMWRQLVKLNQFLR